MKKLISVLITATLLVGCTTAMRTVSNKSGIITATTKVSTFLTAVQGFDDAVAADGSQHTTIANYASDVQAMQVLMNGMIQAAKIGASLAGGTNFTPGTNLVASLPGK